MTSSTLSGTSLTNLISSSRRRQRARGIVRVGHKHDARAVRDGAQHGRQIVPVFPGRHRNHVGAEQLGDDPVIAKQYCDTTIFVSGPRRHGPRIR